MRSPRPSILLLAVLALVAAAYAPALSGGFVWDDHALVEENPKVRALSAPWAWLGSDYWALPLGPTKQVNAYYRPLTGYSFSLDYALGHGAPWPFHLTNLLVHLLGVGLLFGLARRLGASAPAAALAAALHGLFPRGTEAVAWISGRTDALAGTLVLGALFVEAGGPGRLARRGGVAGLLVLALLSKEVALVGLVSVAAWGAWRVARRETSLGTEAWASLPLVVAVVAWAVLRNHALGHQTGVALQSPQLMLATLGRYAVMLAAPWWPNAHQGMPGEAPAWVVALGAVVALALLVVLVRALSPRRDLGARGAVALGAAAAVGLACLFAFGTWTVASDRYLVLPVALGLAALAPSLGSGRALFVGVGLAVSFLPLTSLRAATWADELRFWTEGVAAADPRNPAPHEGLGDVLFARFRLEEAQAEYARAFALSPGDQVELGLASTRSRLGRHAEALETARRLTQAHPDWKRAALDLALFTARTGDFDGAERQLGAVERQFGADPVVRGLRDQFRDARVALEAVGEAGVDTTGAPLLARARAWDSLGATAKARELYGALSTGDLVDPLVRTLALSWLVLRGEPASARTALLTLQAGQLGDADTRASLEAAYRERLGP